MSKSTKKPSVAKAPSEKEVARFVVCTPFRDKHNRAINYESGQDVSHFEAGRLQELVQRKLVKAV